MRIAVLTTQCPFVLGGAELHAANLVRVLRAAGHEAEIVSMPFKWYPSTTVLDHMLAARSMDVSEFNGVKIDLAICLKFPAYLMQHPNKTFWILHQHRQAYDMWDSGQTDLFNDSNGQLVREAVREADNVELGRATRIFANSANVAKRLRMYNNIVAEPLYHPPPLAGRLHTGEYGSYFYYPSRISPTKRQEFVLRSLACSRPDVRVVFSGSADNSDYGDSLRQLAEELGVADRVEWKGFVSEAEMLELYAGARGVLFTPEDEDLGYVVFEAMLAGKPVLTLIDAGEPAAIVRDRMEGYVVVPEHAEFGDAMSRLATSPDLARTMGMAGLERYDTLDISWDKVIARLLDTRAFRHGLPRSAVPAGDDDKGLRRNGPVDAKPGADSSSMVEKVDTSAKERSEICFTRFAERYVVAARFLDEVSTSESNWSRYRAALGALLGLRTTPRKILQIGGGEPYFFACLLAEAFPGAGLTVIQEGPPTGSRTYRVDSKEWSHPGVDIDVFNSKLESSCLPFLAAEFDMVVLIESLERFTVDPSFVLLEARRVLREGGILLATTPNLVSMQSIAKAVGGLSPYEAGEYRPWNGTSARHNREYTPQEVEALGRFAGMESVLLDTVDVDPRVDVGEELRKVVAAYGVSPRLRGQQILYVGRKNASVPQAPFPSSLFAADPRLFSGHVELERAGQGENGFVIRAVNKSPLTWPCTGRGRVRLTVDRITGSGAREREYMSMDLPRDVTPGDFAELLINASTSGCSSYWYEISLHADGLGSFKETGRSQTACLYASSLEVARTGNGDAT
jgi:glycosyltransferase involved in cell wall biosynthesis/SAM-dependent methyltransferase